MFSLYQTTCTLSNVSTTVFTWQLFQYDTTCGSQPVSVVTGEAGGDCAVVQVGSIGSMQVYCNEAVRQHSGTMGTVVAIATLVTLWAQRWIGS